MPEQRACGDHSSPPESGKQDIITLRIAVKQEEEIWMEEPLIVGLLG
jgi:hypothetical protein